MTDRFDDDLRRAARRFAHQPLPDQVLDARFSSARDGRSWSGPGAAIVGGVAVAFALVIGLGQVGPFAVDPTPTPETSPSVSSVATVPTDEVMRERMRMLTDDRGMTWRAEAPDTWIGITPDAELTLVGSPVTSATLVVPAETPQVAYQAVVQYNVAIEAMIEAPPGVTRGWVENALDQWSGTEPLDTSLNEFGFDGTMVSSGEPRVVTLTLHRNPGAWTAEACQGAPIYQDGMGPQFEVGDDEVLVFFGCEWVPNESRAVLRSVADVGTISDRLIVALEALFDGPTSEEEELGYHATVPAEWGDIPFSVELLPDGLAILDFDDAILLGSVPNSSAQLGLLSFSISATAFQFLEVTAIELRVEGSCGAFAVWLGEVGQCIHQAEPVEAVSDCPIVEPMTLPSGAPLTPARSYRNLGGGLSWGSGDDTVTQWVSHRSSRSLEQFADADDAVTIMVGDRQGWAFPGGRELESGIIRPMIAWDDGQGCVYTAYFAAGASLDDLEQGADSFAGHPHDGPVYAGWWSLRSGERDGQAVPPDATGSTLFIDSHSLSGRAPCNSYGADIELAGETITVGDMVATEVGCAEDVAGAESAYLAALGMVTTARIEGGELVFSGPDVELRFTR